jgi:hypothetical protein
MFMTLVSAVAAAIALASMSAAPSAPQAAKSAAAAKELAKILDAAKLDAIAAPDPAEPGAFVAALYIPGSQLLVVSAKYAAPPLLVAKMKNKDYRDIYIDLSAASVVFVIDMNCDGLASKPDNDAAPDSWEAGTQQVSFDGDWKKAKMSEADYGKTFAEADERYAKMLALLAAQAKSGS